MSLPLRFFFASSNPSCCLFPSSSFIFVGVMGYFFYNEIPNSSIVMGGLLIILGGVYIAYRENKFDENKIQIR